MFDTNAEDLSSIAPSIAAPNHQHQMYSRTPSRQQQQPTAMLLVNDDDDEEREHTDHDLIGIPPPPPSGSVKVASYSSANDANPISKNTHHTQNVRRLRHNHVGISFGSTIPQAHLASCPVMNDELDDICSSAEKLRKCSCTRKAPMLNLRREIAAIRTNEDRHLKTQSEQLRQYKDEAKHLSKVSRAFREENARLQRVLEEKSRQVSEAEERRTKEHQRVADIDDKCQNWFVRLDDLRDENDMLAAMSSKSRSEADHLRAALEQAMGENLKLKTAVARKKENYFEGNAQSSRQEQRSSFPPRSTTTATIMTTPAPPPLFCGGSLPSRSSQQFHQPTATTTTTATNQPQQYQPKQLPFPAATRTTTASAASSGGITYSSNTNTTTIGLVEDLNQLRQAVAEVIAKNRSPSKCKCVSGVNTANSEHSTSPVTSSTQHQQQHQHQLQQQQPYPADPSLNSAVPPPNHNNKSNRDCSVPLASHKYMTATTSGGAVYTANEKLERAMDQIRQRVHSFDRELQFCRQEESRWRQTANEMKAILDAQNSSDKERANIFQQQQQRIRELESLQTRHQHQQHHPCSSADNNNNNANLLVPLLHRVRGSPPNAHSATADVTNLESQLQYAKGQIATLDFQLQTLQKQMKSEIDKLRAQKDEAVAAARANVAAETESRLRDEIRQTTSGAFLEEMSVQLQEARKRLQTLEMSHTTSEATKRQQLSEIESLRARLQQESAVAIQLEPTQRELAQAQRERDALRIKLGHVENSIAALRDSEAKCVEEIAHLRARAMQAEGDVEEVHSALNTTTLKLHQEVEANKDLRQRLDDTIDRSNSIVRESKRAFDEQLGEAKEKLSWETNQRVNVEARASALECNLRSVREEVERIRRVQLHWS